MVATANRLVRDAGLIPDWRHDADSSFLRIIRISDGYDLPPEVAAEDETDRPEESTSSGNRRRRRDAVRARLKKLVVGDVTEDDAAEVLPSLQGQRQLRHA